MKSNTSRNLLLFLLSFLGLGAIFGGGVFIISPSGNLFGMPLSMLDNSPFSNFLIPGIILFTILGIIPLMLAFSLVKKPVSAIAEYFNCYKDMYWAWTYCVYVGLALIIWLQTEMVILNAVHWSHSFYMALALAIIIVTLMSGVRQQYKR